ncbi:hypothetical protein B0J14DRAFT_555981 [Halenospora varia]|nr:hypothetical protein B0J14DRAFT_555981 [Halenospora varia]
MVQKQPRKEQQTSLDQNKDITICPRILGPSASINAQSTSTTVSTTHLSNENDWLDDEGEDFEAEMSVEEEAEVQHLVHILEGSGNYNQDDDLEEFDISPINANPEQSQFGKFSQMDCASFINYLSRINIYRVENQRIVSKHDENKHRGGSRDQPTKWLYYCKNSQFGCQKTNTSSQLQREHQMFCSVSSIDVAKEQVQKKAEREASKEAKKQKQALSNLKCSRCGQVFVMNTLLIIMRRTVRIAAPSQRLVLSSVANQRQYSRLNPSSILITDSITSGLHVLVP